MRQQRVLGEHPDRHLVHTRPVREDGRTVLGDTVVELDNLIVTFFLNMQLMLHVSRGEQHLHTDVLRRKIAEIQHNLRGQGIGLGKAVGRVRLRLGDDLHVLPLTRAFFFHAEITRAIL